MEINYLDFSNKAMEQISGPGAFLTVKGKKRINTMTIGWGFIGYMWRKPIFIAAVRYSRYTYELLKETDEFTVSIPLSSEMKKELAFCGSKSGKNYDKFSECRLTPITGEKVSTPYIKECDLHYECKIVYRQTLEAELIRNEAVKENYTNNDYHVMIYGEIVSCHS
ncbi:MAG: flavin reductase family protein [Dethiosulfatibacter sp.]|nr:flavin reductase family protein [Dethiosulfatibacter sp.]